GDLGPTVSDHLLAQLAPKVAGLVSGLFGQFGIEHAVTLLGTTLTLGIKPTQVSIDPSGAQVELASLVTLPVGRTGAGYLLRDGEAPTLGGNLPQGVRLGVADNILNQLLASFWSAGGFDQTIELRAGPDGTIARLFDRVELSLLLPPVVSVAPGGRELH